MKALERGWFGSVVVKFKSWRKLAGSILKAGREWSCFAACVRPNIDSVRQSEAFVGGTGEIAKAERVLFANFQSF